MSRHSPNKHHRRSIRLRQYDYTQPGAYFVTIVTHGRELTFSEPILCRVAETMWQRIPRHFPLVQPDEHVIMPNHVHGVLVVTNPRPDPVECVAPTSGPPSGSLGAIVGNFKSVTARRINGIRKAPGIPVWQRNYYERVIRNERELNAIRQYIRDNPANWAKDQENPATHL